MQKDNNKYYIYAHINKINGKVYIGQTISPKNRWKGKGITYKGCRYFYHAILKYGWDNFHHVILYDNLTKKEVNKLEIILINYYTQLNQSYNIAPGGFGIIGERTLEHKRKISKALKGVPKSDLAKLHMKQNHIPHGEKQVFMCDRNNNVISVFKSVKLASKITGIKSTHIARCARGVRPTAGNYIWKYNN